MKNYSTVTKANELLVFSQQQGWGEEEFSEAINLLHSQSKPTLEFTTVEQQKVISRLLSETQETQVVDDLLFDAIQKVKNDCV